VAALFEGSCRGLITGPEKASAATRAPSKPRVMEPSSIDVLSPHVVATRPNSLSGSSLPPQTEVCGSLG
jgi:hypothetical protein